MIKNPLFNLVKLNITEHKEKGNCTKKNDLVDFI
jgi:hypothetical protein